MEDEKGGTFDCSLKQTLGEGTNFGAVKVDVARAAEKSFERAAVNSS